MTKTILTTKFNFNISIEKLKEIMPSLALEFTAIPGCYWKIWLINEDQKVAGGVYLFESVTQLEQFLKSKLFASVVNHPGYTNFQSDTFCVAEAASLITGARLNKMDV